MVAQTAQTLLTKLLHHPLTAKASLMAQQVLTKSEAEKTALKMLFSGAFGLVTA